MKSFRAQSRSMLSRSTFLAVASLIAFAVGGAALVIPDTLLASKGIVDNLAATVWMCEVGALLVFVAAVNWFVRTHEPSQTLRVLLWGNAALQIILLPIEIIAYTRGVITNLMGIVPNSVLHLLLAIGFAAHAHTLARALSRTPAIEKCGSL
jgi:hypothetical protein